MRSSFEGTSVLFSLHPPVNFVRKTAMKSPKSPISLRGLSYGGGLTLGGVLVIGLSVLFPSDDPGLWVLWGIGGICVVTGGWNLWKWWRGDCATGPISLPEEVHLLPVDQQIEYLQRIFTMSQFVFPGLALYFTFELTRLENGQVESAMLWAPIALLYGALGYWPAVCATPALGLFCLISLNRRLKQLRSGDQPEPPDLNGRKLG